MKKRKTHKATEREKTARMVEEAKTRWAGGRLPEVRLEWIPIARLRPNPIQPPDRATPKAVTDLRETIVMTQYCEPPTVMEEEDRRGYYIVITGGRRVESASGLGLVEIQCVVMRDADTRERFCQLHATQRSFMGLAWTKSWAVSTDPKHRATVLREMPRGSSRRMKQLIRFMGQDGERQLAKLAREHPFSPMTADHVGRLLVAFNNAKIRVDDDDVVRWTIENDEQVTIKDVMKMSLQTQRRHLAKMNRAIKRKQPYYLPKAEREEEAATCPSAVNYTDTDSAFQ